MLTDLINFDTKSLLGILVWGNAAAGVIVFLYHAFNVRNADRNNIRNMTIIRLLCSVGYLLLFFRGNINNIFSVNIGNTILFLSFYLEARLILELANASSKKLYDFITTIFVISVFAFNAIEFYYKDASLRVGMASIIIFSIFLLPTIRIMTSKEITKFKRSISIFYIFLLCALIPRSIQSFLDKSVTLLSNNYYQTLMFIALILMTLSNTIIYLLFMKERTDIIIEKNNMVKTLLNSLSIYMFVTELDTDRVIFINDKMKEQFHLGEDTVGKFCYDIMNPCMNERCNFCVKSKLLEHPDLAESMDTQVEINGVHYKKADRIIEWHDGHMVHLQYFIDVSELKQAEAKLEAQLAQLQSMSALINAAPQYISYVTPDGENIFFNPATCDITGYTHDELMNGGLNILLDDQTKQRIKDEIIPAIYTRGEYEYEIPFIRKDGKVRVMSFSSFAVDSEKDKYGCIATDVTDKKLLESDLIEAKEAAERANKAKSEFLSRMSHEIRTPMNAIIGMTAIAQNSEELEIAKQCLNKIDNASKHLLGVINDILDMSKIEADKFELSYNEFDFYGMFENLVNMVNFRTESKQQVLSVNINDTVPPYIIGDEQRLSQVITNLLSNATKFAPDHGIIELNVKKIDEQDGVCTLQIEVEDNGIGIPPEQQSNIFNSFEQAGGSIARKYGGTGLGLAISKRIVELMGGSIWVESELGSGSRFIFTIEAMKGSGQSIDTNWSNSISSHNDFSNHTVLLAEDVEINTEIILTVLEETGVTIDAVPNGLEAVRHFRNDPNRYSLILMDINMPEMDGYEATRSIRTLDCEKARTVPIVAMTADVFKEDIERCLAAGMNDHIGKPLDLDELFAKLNKYLLQ